MRGRRLAALGAALALGLGAAASAGAAGVFVPPGPRITPGPATPKAFVHALAGRQVLVVVFLRPGLPDDALVARAVSASSLGHATRNGVRYMVYQVSASARIGDLPHLLDMTSTPSVAVIGRNRTLVNRWNGLVDSQILAQAIADAKATPYRPVVPAA